MRIKKVLILLFVFLNLTVWVSAGVVNQTIYSPFNTVIAGNGDDYESNQNVREATTVFANNKYKDLKSYLSIGSPYCRIGGQYLINVYNDIGVSRAAGGIDWQGSVKSKIYNETFKLFYCKSAKNLLEEVYVPKSWNNSDLVVYCNDGVKTGSNSSNFDFITNSINTYKVCVVKNLDLEENNSVMYGFETGNRQVDNDVALFFDSVTNTSPILVGFEQNGIGSKYLKEGLVYGGRAFVPYLKEVIDDCSSSSFRDCTPRCQWRERNETELMEWISNTSNKTVGKITNKANYIDSSISLSTCSNINFTKAHTDCFYEVVMNFTNYDIGYRYTKNNENYYFHYVEEKRLYSLSDFMLDMNDDTNLVSVLDIFPKGRDVNLSRVILFSKRGGKLVYGYEEPMNALGPVFADIIEPSYIVKLEGFSGFNENKCLDSLKSFNKFSTGLIEDKTQIYCSGNEIKIISKNINSVDEKYKSFNLFKNIVMGLR